MSATRRLSQSRLVAKLEAERRPCPPAPKGCGAAPGTPCTYPATGSLLGRQLAHAARLFPPVAPAPVEDEPRPLDFRELAAGARR